MKGDTRLTGLHHPAGEHPPEVFPAGRKDSPVGTKRCSVHIQDYVTADPLLPQLLNAPETGLHLLCCPPPRLLLLLLGNTSLHVLLLLLPLSCLLPLLLGTKLQDPGDPQGGGGGSYPVPLQTRHISAVGELYDCPEPRRVQLRTSNTNKKYFYIYGNLF